MPTHGSLHTHTLTCGTTTQYYMWYSSWGSVHLPPPSSHVSAFPLADHTGSPPNVPTPTDGGRARQSPRNARNTFPTSASSPRSSTFPSKFQQSKSYLFL